MKDYLLYADCHSTTKETLILETKKAKCQVDDKFDDKVVVKNASPVPGGAEQVNKPTPPSLVVAHEGPHSCCHKGTCSKQKKSAPNLVPTNLPTYNPTDVDDAIKRIWGFDNWTHDADQKFTDWLEKNSENKEQQRLQVWATSFVHQKVQF